MSDIDPSVLGIVVSLVALAIAGYLLWKRKEPLTAQGVVTTLQEAHVTATEIAEVVRAAVFAAEQLKATGQLPSNNEAFEFAYHHAHKLLPSLEKETLEMWIESMVPLANAAINKDGVPNVTPRPTPTVGRMGGLN